MAEGKFLISTTAKVELEATANGALVCVPAGGIQGRRSSDIAREPRTPTRGGRNPGAGALAGAALWHPSGMLTRGGAGPGVSLRFDPRLPSFIRLG